jgi:transglutaminase-like putative cysteine protease
MKYSVKHRTSYRYSSNVTTSHHEARLLPRATEQQKVLAAEVLVTPTPSSVRRRQDYFGNRTMHFSISEPHRALDVVATSVVEITPVAPPLPELSPPWEDVVERLASDRRRDVLDAYQMTFESPHVTKSGDFLEFGRPAFSPGRPVLEAVNALSGRIHSEFAYDNKSTDVSTPLSQVLEQKRGVCQDFAHLMIACLRSLGLAARYVSGYLLTRPPPGKPKLVGADASHAWVSVWLPRSGWIDFDPTNDVMPREEHITTAYGRDFSDVTPLRGVILGGGQHVLEVSVDVNETD